MRGETILARRPPRRGDLRPKPNAALCLQNVPQPRRGARISAPARRDLAGVAGAAARIRGQELFDFSRPRHQHAFRLPRAHRRPPHGRGDEGFGNAALVGAHERHHGRQPRRQPGHHALGRDVPSGMNGDAGMNGCVAVFDIGKTNMKVVVFDAAGKVVAERGCPNAPLAADAKWPYLKPHMEGARLFLIAAHKGLGARFSIEAISTTAHGCAGVLMGRDGVALPPLDYEFDGFAAVDAAYVAARPPYDETRAPQ